MSILLDRRETKTALDIKLEKKKIIAKVCRNYALADSIVVASKKYGNFSSLSNSRCFWLVLHLKTYYDINILIIILKNNKNNKEVIEMKNTIPKTKPNKKNTYNKTSHTIIIEIRDTKQEKLDIPTCIKNWENTATTIKHYADTILNNREQQIIQNLYNKGKRDNSKPTTIGNTLQTDSRNIGNNITGRTNEYLNLKGYSRIDKMIQASVIPSARNTDTRRKKYDQLFNHYAHGEPKPYIKAGLARTITPTSAKPGKLLDLTAASNQYCKLININEDKTIATYLTTCGNDKVELDILIPQHLRDADKILQPKMVWNTNTNEFNIILTGQYYLQKTKLSDRYIIGVDVGIKHYVTYIVWDKKENKVIEKGTLSNYLDKELHTSINKTKDQIKNLWLKIETIKNNPEYDWLGRIKENQYQEIERLYKDIQDQRKALSNKRLKMAIESALEIKNLSIKYGNAPVARENLAWVGNTMQNGRWNCGEFFARLQELLEKDGGLSVYVSAYKTSQTCSSCGNTYKKDGSGIQFHYDTSNRVVHCDLCSFEEDRDVNAAVNIAKRALEIDSLENRIVRSQPGTKHKGKLFERGRSRKWHRERQKNNNVDRSKNKPTPKRRTQEELKKIDVVSPVFIPSRVRSLARESEGVSKYIFLKFVCPLQFKSLSGVFYNTGVTFDSNELARAISIKNCEHDTRRTR